MTCSEAAIDKFIFEASMSKFQKASEAENPSICERLNFGYRNTKLQGRFTSSMKTRIDDNFKKDLYEYCARFSSSAKGVECRDVADRYVFLRRRLRWAGNPVDFGEDAHDRLKKAGGG
ncbi:secretory phospholipase A2 [Beauveria brongniartii RCEF 3172]|uniref:Secretory phospholipase A2 n=1 Tax=Beauveria brongniartii RCEF 3172 TaxID=1081107 RepID=A0A167HPW7_9HYPO|nr:secretory phospholipase A2 [Beauveria brongniartii RCEF 3172]